SRWHVSADVTVSDHKWIMYDLATDKVEPSVYRNPMRTNWDLFLGDLMKSLEPGEGNPKTCEEVEEALSNLERNLLSSYEVACPLRRAPVQKSRFWSHDLEKLRKNSRKLFNRAQHTKSTSDWTSYKVAIGEYKSTLRAAKRKPWLRFCDEVKDLKTTA